MICLCYLSKIKWNCAQAVNFNEITHKGNTKEEAQEWGGGEVRERNKREGME